MTQEQPQPNERLQASIDTVRKMMPRFRPDEDVIIVAHLFDANGEQYVYDLRFTSNAEKRLTYEAALPNFIAEHKAVEMITINPTWFVSRPNDIDPTTVIPSEQPDRREAVLFQYTNGTDEEMWIAEVHRHDGAPPTMDAEVERMDPTINRILRPSMAALRANWTTA